MNWLEAALAALALAIAAGLVLLTHDTRPGALDDMKSGPTSDDGMQMTPTTRADLHEC